MSRYESRLAAFSEGRRLLRLRHTVKNRDNVACDPCGSMEPQSLHILKDEGAQRYFFAGSNCVQALIELGVVRQRYASDLAEQTYEQELARQHAGWERHEDDLELPADGTPSSSEPAAVAGDAPVLVAAVVALKSDEWARVLAALPLGSDRWRLIALDDRTSRLADLLEWGANRPDRSI